MDKSSKTIVFSTLHAISGYWQIGIIEKNHNKTTLFPYCSLYGFVQMPFCSKIATATFCRTMDVILSFFEWCFALIYFDEMVVFSKKSERHMEHVHQVLVHLETREVTLKLKKCTFSTDMNFCFLDT